MLAVAPWTRPQKGAVCDYYEPCHKRFVKTEPFVSCPCLGLGCTWLVFVVRKGEDAMAERVTVVIVDDLEVVRIGVRAGLENSERIAVVAEGSSEADAKGAAV